MTDEELLMNEQDISLKPGDFKVVPPMEVVKRNVYQMIAVVTHMLAKTGIGKTQTNKQDGYSYDYRGIDDVYNALAPVISEVGLVILPEVLERSVIEKPSRSGGTLFFTTLRVKYTFVSADDGSSHEVVTYGEAMDSGDKSTNKAMSAAYKYACFQVFAIPTEAMDSEADTPEPVSEVQQVIDKLNVIFEVDTAAKTVECIDEDAFIELCNYLHIQDQEFKLSVWSEINRQFDIRLDGRSTVASRIRSVFASYRDGEREAEKRERGNEESSNG